MGCGQDRNTILQELWISFNTLRKWFPHVTVKAQ